MKILIVAGGLDWPLLMDSTEKFDGLSWSLVGLLPRKVDGIRGISINNEIFFTGIPTIRLTKVINLVDTKNQKFFNMITKKNGALNMLI